MSKTFKLGINMAGAVSAGAYTAGVLDFLTEALDEWYAAKSRGEAVPIHDVSIEVLTGASAGGMCAAIAACLLKQKFDHIHDTNLRNTTNRLYEAWVNRIDIAGLLTTDDLLPRQPVTSLLNSNTIREIAAYAIDLGSPAECPYVAPNAALFVTVTNVRGVPYALYQDPNPEPSEFVTYHADRLLFQSIDQSALPALRSAAIATGAFPAFLRPEILERRTSDYDRPGWLPLSSGASATASVLPAWPEGVTDPYFTVNVDGGATNNTPFALAYDYLSTFVSPPVDLLASGADPRTVDRAVLTIAPFPGNPERSAEYDAKKESALFRLISNLLSALISQSRFLGESLAAVTQAANFSRYFIAPSDEHNPQNPLQCAALGAFGGFFERRFRAHDFQLGRRNCQMFLKHHFLLPVTNALFGGLPRPTADAFARPPHVKGNWPPDQRWLPVIPLCGKALPEVPYPKREVIDDQSLKRIVGLVVERAKAILPLLLGNSLNIVLRFAIIYGVGMLVKFFGGQREIKKYFIAQLGNSYRMYREEAAS